MTYSHSTIILTEGDIKYPMQFVFYLPIETQFKTMKYRPDYPKQSGSAIDARVWVNPFMYWYNNVHRHSGLGLMAPAPVHAGLATELTEKRRAVLHAAHEKHPERFVHGQPSPPKVPDAVWIDPPLDGDDGKRQCRACRSGRCKRIIVH